MADFLDPMFSRCCLREVIHSICISPHSRWKPLILPGSILVTVVEGSYLIDAVTVDVM